MHSIYMSFGFIREHQGEYESTILSQTKGESILVHGVNVEI